mmetsp:Transcript_53224/g.134002  ORF Transcript_53224/g.134002 Transcript_53224/m.134002 type:complete len:86 (+) Transcript_53224:469-726(+)
MLCRWLISQFISAVPQQAFRSCQRRRDIQRSAFADVSPSQRSTGGLHGAPTEIDEIVIEIACVYICVCARVCVHLLHAITPANEL